MNERSAPTNERSGAAVGRAAALAITLNGKAHDVPAGTTISGLLQSLGIAAPGTAVAVNERVIRASAHAGHELAAGDTVEIVRAASGG